MKRNAFTLIELLATIVILSIIFLFVTPNIIKLINEAKESNRAIIEEKLIDAGKEYVSEYNKDFVKNFINVDDTAYISVTELIEIGLIDQEEVNNLNGNVSVKVVLKENDTLEYSINYS
jgi:prepilin-type N-terminal cleavage/methylation domain-containing protein